MEYEARRFARRVLLIHLAILLVLGLVLVWAADVLYRGAREQAIEQAKLTQELLTKQTALGIQNYYESVTGVVDLLQPLADQATTDPTELPEQHAATRPRARPPQQARRANGEPVPVFRLNNAMGNAIWFSIRDKANLLFVVDPADDMNIVRLVGAAPDAPDPKEVITACRDWLAATHHRSLSPFLRFDKTKGGDAHLVVAPLRNSNGLLIAALVPIARLERDVLSNVNQSANDGAMIVDESGAFLSANRPGVVGKNIDDLTDPRTRELAVKRHASKFSGTIVFDREEQLGDVTFGRAMTTIHPFTVLGQTWSIIVSSNLNQIEDFIKPVFRKVIIWAICVAIAIALLLGSTAFQLIRSRSRLDRMQREVLTREISEARRIQLHWLPKGNCNETFIQVAAINRPATHVSGDFYNWFPLDDGKFAVTIGDVTGHGMAAAFLMATTQLLVRNILPRVHDPGLCLKEVNKQLVSQSFNGQFVTIQILVIDPQRGHLDIATAGHPPPIVSNGDGFKLLDLEPQLVLGVEAGSEYPTQRFDLSSGQSIALYTDGAIDAEGPDGTRFTTEGLTASLHGKIESAESMLRTLDDAVNHFRAGRDLVDDLTLVAIQVQSKSCD